MASKPYSTVHRAAELEPHHQFSVIPRTHLLKRRANLCAENTVENEPGINEPGLMAMNEYTTCPKVAELEPPHRIHFRVISRLSSTLLLNVYLFVHFSRGLTQLKICLFLASPTEFYMRCISLSLYIYIYIYIYIKRERGGS